MKTAQRVFFFVLLLTVACLLFTTPKTFAQTSNTYAKPNLNPDVPTNLHTWTQTVMIEVLAAFNCQLTGIDPTTPHQKCLGIDSNTGKIGFVENGNGLLGLMANGIGLTFIKPVGLGDYANYLASNFGLGRPVLAAEAGGSGFKSIEPLTNLWLAFRNIVYMLFIIVFVIVGVAIMLRVKIDPRTVMTIENQIPKIIIGLILVTFSFAIAGFLIDLMWITIYVTIGVLAQTDPKLTNDIYHIAHATDPFGAANIIGGTTGAKGGLGALVGPPAAGIAGFVSQGIDSIPALKGLVSMFGGIIAGVLVSVLPLSKLIKGAEAVPFVGPLIAGAAAGALTYAFTQQIVSFFSGAIASVVIAIAMLWALFRIWFALMTAYVSILLQVIFAPFWIIGGVIPGSSIGFSGWLKSIVANLLVFPATIGLLLLGKVMMDRFNNVGASIFVPPLVGDPTRGNQGGIGSLIGLGILLLAPQVATMIKEAFKAPQMKQGAAVGQAIGVGLGAVNILEHAKQVGMYQYYTGGLRKFPILGKLLGRGEEDKTGRQS